MRKLGIAILAVAALGVGPAGAVNTHRDWDKSSNVGNFGCGASTNYGQVITIKGYRDRLKDFSFWLRGQANAGQSMAVRAEVFGWDGTKPTGAGKPLFESAPRTIAFSDSKFHQELFTVNIPVTPNAQYVVFLTVDRDYAQCMNGYSTTWGIVSDTSYAGGTFVYLNSEGDSSQWTTTSWTTTYGNDLVFTASQLGEN